MGPRLVTAERGGAVAVEAIRLKTIRITQLGLLYPRRWDPLAEAALGIGPLERRIE